MTDTSDPGAARPVTVAFATCFDAATFGRTVRLTAAEEGRLLRALAVLQRLGFVAPPSLAPAAPALDLADVVAHLRGTVGRAVLNAALASPVDPGAGAGPPPAALMPVWAFEPEAAGGDAMLSSGMLWGGDVLTEAPRVEGDDDARPAAAVRERFARWAAAAGPTRDRRTMRLPGQDGAYVLFAAGA